MSPIADELRAIIESEGPISLERFMGLALGHPDHGYYMTRDPFGAAGDFTTSPEISQMFGELIGVWAAETWLAMGKPKPVLLIELGPGRGTLMSDALRAARVAPEFRSAIDVRLVETSPTLAAIQRETLLSAGAPVSWAQSLGATPDGPAIIIANEFLDALPIRQFMFARGAWRERLVGLDREKKFVFQLSKKPEETILGLAKDGSILEVNPGAHRLARDVGARLARGQGAALFIDYGHTVTSIGDTLQALRAHKPVDPLAEPGEADITAHVDFASVARAARSAGASAHGPVDQGDFLLALGLRQRTEALAGRANPTMADDIRAAAERLAGKGDGQMGALFKVLAITPRGAPAPAGFARLGRAP